MDFSIFVIIFFIIGTQCIYHTLCIERSHSTTSYRKSPILPTVILDSSNDSEFFKLWDSVELCVKSLFKMLKIDETILNYDMNWAISEHISNVVCHASYRHQYEFAALMGLFCRKLVGLGRCTHTTIKYATSTHIYTIQMQRNTHARTHSRTATIETDVYGRFQHGVLSLGYIESI